MPRQRGAVRRRPDAVGPTSASASSSLPSSSMAATAGLGATDEKLLEPVLRLDRPTAGDLARKTGLAPASVTRAVDRLVAKGLVQRSRDPDDARRVRVAAVPALVQKLFSRQFTGLLSRLSELYVSLDDPQLATVVKVLERMARIQAEEAVRVGES